MGVGQTGREAARSLELRGGGLVALLLRHRHREEVPHASGIGSHRHDPAEVFLRVGGTAAREHDHAQVLERPGAVGTKRDGPAHVPLSRVALPRLGERAPEVALADRARGVEHGRVAPERHRIPPDTGLGPRDRAQADRTMAAPATASAAGRRCARTTSARRTCRAQSRPASTAKPSPER